MQEVTGSSPVSPTTHRFRARRVIFSAQSGRSVSTALRDRLTARVGSAVSRLDAVGLPDASGSRLTGKASSWHGVLRVAPSQSRHSRSPTSGPGDGAGEKAPSPALIVRRRPRGPRPWPCGQRPPQASRPRHPPPRPAPPWRTPSSSGPRASRASPRRPRSSSVACVTVRFDPTARPVGASRAPSRVGLADIGPQSAARPRA